MRIGHEGAFSMRTDMRMQVVVGLIMLLIGPARAEEFPADVVRWVPALNKPVFQGAGGKAWDRYIRERGWILIEEGTYHLWYTGFKKDRSPLMLLGHATSPDGLRWTRDKTNPLETSSWVEDMCVVHRGDMYFMFAEGNEDIAAASPAHVARWRSVGRARTAGRTQGRWLTHHSGTLRNADGVGRERSLVSLL
jgi:hypothetical protein